MSDGSTRFSDVPATVWPTLKTETVLSIFQADWGPTMRGIAWALGHAVAIPAAVLIVMAQWVAFTYQRPLAGVLALVPVRKPDPIDAIGVAQLTRSELCHVGATETMDEVLTDFADFAAAFNLYTGSPNLADAAPNLASSSPNLADDAPPTREISPALDAALNQAIGLARPVRPVAPQPPALAPAPRRQRRRSKRPQAPA